MNVHMNTAPVGVFSTRGSCGQLLVYVIVSPGRSVVAAQDVQKKNAFSAADSPAVSIALTGSAYCSRSASAAAELP